MESVYDKCSKISNTFLSILNTSESTNSLYRRGKSIEHAPVSYRFYSQQGRMNFFRYALYFLQFTCHRIKKMAIKNITSLNNLRDSYKNNEISYFFLLTKLNLLLSHYVFVLKMLPAFYICCIHIYSSALKLFFFHESKQYEH